MLKSKKKALALAVLCAVSSMGFMSYAYAEEPAEPDSTAQSVSTQAEGSLNKGTEQTENRPIFALDTMVVEGQRETLPGNFVSREGNLGRLGNRNIMDVPFTQTNFSEKTLEKFNDPSAALTNVLINTPSVKSSSYTLYNDFSIRGIGLTGYNLYVNGVPGLFTQSTLPTNFVERVEVVAGPAMGFNGTTIRESAGGLVNLYTKRAGDEDITRYTQSFSGESSFGEHIDFSRRFGKNKEWGLRINAENVSGKELSGVGEDLTNRDFYVNLDHFDENSKTNLFMGYSYSNLEKSARWFQFGSNVTNLPSAPNSKMNYAYDGQGATLDRWGVVLNHEQKINNDWTAFFNGGYSRYDLYNNKTGRASQPYTVINNNGDFESVDRDGPLAITNYYGETGVKGQFNTGEVKHNLVLSIDKSWSTQWSGSGNLVQKYAGNLYDGRTENFNPDVSSGVSLDKASNSQFWGVAAVDTLEFGKAQLMLGIHNQHSRVYNYSSNSEVDSSGTSPLYGITYKPVDNLSLYASHTESFSGGSAVTNSKYINKGAILDPAKTKQNEIGVKYENAGLLTTLSAFEIKKAGTTDEYVGRINGSDMFRCTQDGENEYKGIELSVNGKVAPKWNIMGGFMYLDAKRNKTSDSNMDGIGDYDGYRVNGASRWNGVLALEYEANDDFSVLGRAVYNGSSTINNGDLDVPAYMSFDLGLNYKTKINNTPVTLSAMCYNVTGKDYWIPQSGTNYLALSNPRTFMLTAQFDL